MKKSTKQSTQRLQRQPQNVSVQAGAVTEGIADGVSLSKKFFNTLFKGLDKLLDIKGWETKHKGIVTVDGEEWSQYQYRSGSDDIVDVYIRPDESSRGHIDLVIKYAGKSYPCKHNPIKKEKLQDYITTFMDEHDLGSNEGQVTSTAASNKIQVTLKRVTAGTEDTINLVAISANCNISAANHMLDDVLADDEFTDMITEEPVSYEIVEVEDEDEYDVNEIDNSEVDTSSCYEDMLRAAVILSNDIHSIIWGAKGLKLKELRDQLECRTWDCRNFINTLAELVVEKTGKIPHLSQYCNESDIPDLSAGFGIESGIRVAQHSFEQFIDTIEGYYVNLDHDVQTLVDQWIRDLKKQCEYFMERQLMSEDLSQAVSHS